MASRLTTFIVALIVGGTVIAGLIVGAQREDESRVDLIITNGQVFTGAGEALAEAIAVQGNRILRVGSNREIKRMRRPQTLMLDAHGATVLPGLIDTHVHLGAAAAAAAGVDLADAEGPDDVQARISAFAEAHPGTRWVRGRGWGPGALPDSIAPRALLDEALPERPAYLVSADGRTAWVNSTALAVAGISRQTPNPRNGVIVRDPRTGEPTGTLRDTAATLVARALPPLTEVERLEGLESAIAEAHRAGITSVHSLGDTAGELALYEGLRAQKALRLRVYSVLTVPEVSGLPDVDALGVLQERFPDDPLVKAGGVFVPWPAGPVRRADPPAIETLATVLDARGWQVLIEVPTDAAVPEAIEALEAARKVNVDREVPRRNRLEGLTSLSAERAARLAELDVTASLQPSEETLDASTCAVAVHAGARLTFGSNWPDADVHPLETLAAVIEPSTVGPTAGAADAESVDQHLTLEQAVEAHTSVAAWSSFDEQRKGRLARGLLADIVILSTDIFTPGRRLSDAEVDTTIFDGKVVYSRAALMGTH